MNVFNNVYKGKKVLVTGHTGFKGSWLCIWLKELGANVIGYSLDPHASEDNFNLSGLKDKVVDIRGDIRDYDKLESVFKEYKPEFVFHLAAQPLVRESYKCPRETYEVNVMGTLNVLECIRETDSVKVGVMITTDKCYENKEQIWGYRETDPMGGYDPYSSSKGCAELLISSYRSSYFNINDFENHKKAISSVRAGNVIGGGDWAKDRIVPDCIRALRDNKEIIIRNPYAVRPWQYVLEPLSGYLWLGCNMYNDGRNYSGAWNFGPDYESIISVKEIADLVIDNWGRGSWSDASKNGDMQPAHEANLLILDCTKAKTYLRWKSILNIKDAIKLAVEWYKCCSNVNVYDLCKKQIDKYISIAISKNIEWITTDDMHSYQEVALAKN